MKRNRKNDGFIALLIDSLFCFLISIIILYFFHHYYNEASNSIKIILLLAIIFVIPLCLGIITASISAKPTIGRKIVKRNVKKNKKSSKDS